MAAIMLVGLLQLVLTVMVVMVVMTVALLPRTMIRTMATASVMMIAMVIVTTQIIIRYDHGDTPPKP